MTAKLIIGLLLFSTLANAAEEIPGSTKYKCINNIDNMGEIVVAYKENANGEKHMFSIDLSGDTNGVGAPYFQGMFSRDAKISSSTTEIVLKHGHSYFLPLPLPNPNGGWFRPGTYADYDKINLDLTDMTLVHKQVKSDPNDSENSTDEASYHGCKRI